MGQSRQALQDTKSIIFLIHFGGNDAIDNTKHILELYPRMVCREHHEASRCPVSLRVERLGPEGRGAVYINDNWERAASSN